MLNYESPIKDVRPDTKGRITLGKDLTDGVSHFKIFSDIDGSLKLLPYVDIPKSELWLYKNQDALDSITRGLQDIKAGKVAKINWNDGDINE